MKNCRIIIFFILNISLFGQGVTISNNSIFNLGSAVFNLSSNWINNGTVNTSNGTIGFTNASGNQTYSDDSGADINNFVVNKAAGDVVLLNNITVNGMLTCTSGDLELNGKIIILGNLAGVSEAASATIKGNSGHIEATRDLNAPNNLDVAGLGLTLTSAVNLGSTKIIRAHKSQTTNTNGSIKRAFDVAPTTNTNLNATVVFKYDDDELNGLNEADLQLYKSTDGGLTWLTQGGILDAASNTVTLAGVQDFSLWTLGVNEGPAISNAGGTISYQENSQIEIFNALLLSDPDDINCESVVVQITNNYLQAEDVLSFTDKNGITGAWDNINGKLTLSGSATKDDYVAAIRSITYGNGSSNPTELTRTVSIYTNDGNNNSNTLTRDIEVHEANNIPILAVNNTGHVEEGGVFILSDQFLRAQDADGSTYSITFNVVEEPKYGTLTFSGALLKTNSSITFSQNDIANGKLKYIHGAGEESSDYFRFYLSDDKGGASGYFTFTIEIFGSNDPPQADSLTCLSMKEDEKFILNIREWFDCINDPDNDDSTLIFSVYSDNENIFIKQLTDSTCEITSKQDYFGGDSLRVVFKDSDKDSCQLKTYLEIVPVNDLPQFSDLPPLIEVTSNTVKHIYMWDYISDVETPDSLLKLGFESDNDSLFCSYNFRTGTISILAQGSYEGRTNLTIKIIDTSGGLSSAELLVNITQEITDVETEGNLPGDYQLSQNYPNPFNPSTVIRYSIAAGTSCQSGAVSVLLRIYDILGNEVATLVNEQQSPGYYEHTWNAGNISSGIYFYMLNAGNYKEIKKMVLVK